MFKGISIDLFEKDSKILEAEDELQLYKKRIIKDDQDNNEKIKKNQIIISRKRKKRGDVTEGKHGKYSSVNIIKKIKGLFFKNLVVLMNKILQKKAIIRDLNYKKYINHVNKNKNLKYLHLCIKDLYF